VWKNGTEILFCKGDTARSNNPRDITGRSTGWRIRGGVLMKSVLKRIGFNYLLPFCLSCWAFNDIIKNVKICTDFVFFFVVNINGILSRK
jgi:hypothetical protein